MTSKLRGVRVTHVVPGTPTAAFTCFNDYSGWKHWAGFPPVTLDREGTDHPSGVGAIRRFAIIPAVREEIVEFIAPDTMSYTLLGGAPIRNHLGTVTFTADGDQCAITWQAQYEPTIPGTGALIDAVVQWFFRRILHRLGNYLVRQGR